MKWLILCFVFFLSACGGPISKDELATTKRMGVLVELGEDFHLSAVGTTILTNQYGKNSVKDWEINEKVAATAARAIRNSNSFEASVFRPEGISFNEKIDGKGLDRIYEQAIAQGFDRLFIVRSHSLDSPPRMQGGYGLYVHYFLGMGETCIYTSFTLRVVDLRTKKTLTSDISDVYPCKRGSEGKFVYKKDLNEYSSEDQARIRYETLTHIENIMLWGLQRFGVTR